MAMITAAIANDGVMMKPNLIRVVRSADLQVVDRPTTEELGRPISSDVAAQLTDMMRGVVQSGTGTAAQISGVDVVGKTGTAEHGNSSAPHAWFTSFAPAGNPKVVVTVVVEDGGRLGDAASGGRVAAPIARQVMEAVLAS
jgi:peptidoglycan glycosyltransferase